MSDSRWYYEWYYSSFDKLKKQLYSTLLIANNAILRDVVDDCLQDAYVLLWKKRNDLRQHENLYGWLYITATNRLNDRLKRDLFMQRNGYVLHPDESIDSEMAQEFIDRHREEAEIADKIDELRELIGDEKFRLIYEYYREAKTKEELAREYGITPNALKSRVRRIIKSLGWILINKIFTLIATLFPALNQYVK